MDIWIHWRCDPTQLQGQVVPVSEQYAETYTIDYDLDQRDIVIKSGISLRNWLARVYAFCFRNSLAR